MKVVLITNKITNIKYVGLYTDDESYYFTNFLLKRAISIYYSENFTIEILFIGENNEAIEYYEKYKTDNKIIFSPEYYNIPETEEERKAYKDYIDLMNAEDYKKWREEHKYLYQTQEFREKASAHSKGVLNPMYGKKHSEQSKYLMSIHTKGKYVGEKNPNYGNRGDKAKNGKTIYKYEDSAHTKLIKAYNTLGLALEDLGLKGHSNLYKAMKNNTEYKGFYWSE